MPSSELASSPSANGVPTYSAELRTAGGSSALKWSDLRYEFNIKEDCNGKETQQA